MRSQHFCEFSGLNDLIAEMISCFSTLSIWFVCVCLIIFICIGFFSRMWLERRQFSKQRFSTVEPLIRQKWIVYPRTWPNKCWVGRSDYYGMFSWGWNRITWYGIWFYVKPLTSWNNWVGGYNDMVGRFRTSRIIKLILYFVFTCT